MRLKSKRSAQQAAADLGGHDQLVVDDVVRREAHAEESAGGVQVARHARACVHVLPETLKHTHIHI